MCRELAGPLTTVTMITAIRRIRMIIRTGSRVVVSIAMMRAI